MNPKTSPLVLAMFTILCALPAAGVVPAAIAQEGTSSDEEGLVGGIISNVLDGSDDEPNGDSDAEVNQDSTDTATVNPNQEDQTGDQEDVAIFGDNTADFDYTNVDLPMAITTPTPDDRLPPEGDVVFCLELVGETISCFDTLEQCELGEGFLADVISECERFETILPDAFLCVAEEGGISCIRE